MQPQTRPAPLSSHSQTNTDGTVTVTYARDGKWTETITYPDRRTASIESMLMMFPGTSREWLESMHAQNGDVR